MRTALHSAQMTSKRVSSGPSKEFLWGCTVTVFIEGKYRNLPTLSVSEITLARAGLNRYLTIGVTPNPFGLAAAQAPSVEELPARFSLCLGMA